MKELVMGASIVKCLENTLEECISRWKGRIFMQHSVPVAVLSLPRRVRILMENTYYLVEYEVSRRVILEEAEAEGEGTKSTSFGTT